MYESPDIEVDSGENTTEVGPASDSRFSKASRQRRIRNVEAARVAGRQRRRSVPSSPTVRGDKASYTTGRPVRRGSKRERLLLRGVAVALGVLAVGGLVHHFTEPSVSKSTTAIERVEADIARQANVLPGGQIIHAGNGQVNEQVVTGDETLVVTGAEGSNGKVNPNKVTSANVTLLEGDRALVAGIQLNTQTTSPGDVSVYADSNGGSISAKSSTLDASETAEIAALAKGLLENNSVPPNPDQLPRV